MHFNTVFTPPQGFGWPIKKYAKWNTLEVAPASMRGVIRVPLQQFPIWCFELAFNYTKGSYLDLNNGYRYIQDFFNARHGRADSFLFEDSYDNQATNSYFGTGDGTSNTFQLLAQRDNYSDLVQSVNFSRSAPVVYANGTALSSSAYSVSPLGVATFTTPPANGTILTWTGNFYYVVHFSEDSLEFDMIMPKIWDAFTVKLEGVIL